MSHKCLIITDSTLQWRFSPLCIFNCSLVQCNSMGLISFLVFQCRTAFDVDYGLPRDLKHLTLSDVDNLEIANYSNLTTVFYPLGNFRQALCIRSCHEDLVLTRKSHNCPHNCAGIAFIQGDSLCRRLKVD